MSVVLVLSSILIAVVSVFYLQTESVLSPVSWKHPNSLPSFEGPTAVNSLLKNAIKIASGNFSGPESLAFDPESGTVYASFNDGSVGSFSEKGKYLSRVFFVGHFQDHNPHFNAIESTQPSLFNLCHEEAESGRLAWDKEGEYKCGRPLGLRFRKVNSVQSNSQ